MPDGNGGSSFTHYLGEISNYLAAALAGMIAWVTNRQVKRVDEIEKNYVSTAVLNNTVESLRGDIKGIHKRLDNIIDLLKSEAYNFYYAESSWTARNSKEGVKCLKRWSER